MKIYLACDHAGFELKEKIKESMTEMAWEDLGVNSADSVDYPDLADKVCEKLCAAPELDLHDMDAIQGPCMGLLICGSGQGMAIRANRYSDVRAALCWNAESAALSREHNNANILCLGARFLTLEQAQDMIRIFFQTKFAGGRHSKRVAKLSRDTNC